MIRKRLTIRKSS